MDAPPGGPGVSLDDAFERILASLYRAARDDAHWPAASALIDEAVGTRGSSLMVGEGSGEDGDEVRMYYARALERGEDRADLAREYLEVYYPHDEAPARLRFHPEGRLVYGPDLYTEEELKTSFAYNEGWRRGGIDKGLAVRLEEPDGLRTAWSIGNPVDGDGWQSDRLRLLERLLPHVRHFVAMRQALAAADALGSGLSGLLENDRIGVVQLDRGGRVLAANAPALAILRQGDGLIDRDGALDAWLPADRSRLQRLLARALPDLWGEVPAGGSMTVQRSSGRSRLALHVSPVGGGEADFGARRVAALVLAVDPARRARIQPARVSTMLGLSPSEGRMSALLAEGLKVREIAEATQWSEDYVRWLTKQVYRKLGVSGQVELVRQVLAVDPLPWR